MNKIQQLIWMDFFVPLWKNRNKLLYYTVNYYTQADNNKLTESIIWYCDNHLLLFAHYNTHLADNINTDALNKMTQEQKQEWLCDFEIAKEAYEKEQQFNEMKQNPSGNI